MIIFRRAEERHHEQHRKREVWLTFYPPDQADPVADSFAPLENLDEILLSPDAEMPRPMRPDADIVAYVREGALRSEDSADHSGVDHAGEFHLMTAGRGVSHCQTNASRTHWSRVFQIRLRLSEGEPSHEQKRFSAAERRGVLRVIASPDARKGSLRLYQDALIYSALLDPGQHVVHELSPGRKAWLHVVEGEVVLGDGVLSTGAGAGFSAERAVSLTTQEETEILLLDLGEPLRRRRSDNRGQL